MRYNLPIWSALALLVAVPSASAQQAPGDMQYHYNYGDQQHPGVAPGDQDRMHGQTSDPTAPTPKKHHQKRTTPPPSGMQHDE